MAAAAYSVGEEENKPASASESVPTCQLITDNEMKARLDIFSTLVVFISHFIPAWCRSCGPSCMTMDLCFFLKTLEKDLACALLLHSCFITLAAAPLSEMGYVQGAGLKTSYDNTSCYGPLFEENHVPGVSHHLPRITPHVALFPGSVLSVWTSKSFSAEPNFPLLTLRITAENECVRMLQQQMESPDVIAPSAASNTH